MFIKAKLEKSGGQTNHGKHSKTSLSTITLYLMYQEASRKVGQF